MEILGISHNIHLRRKPAWKEFIFAGIEVPDVEIWRLVEALSLLEIMVRAERVEVPVNLSLFGKTGPVKLREEGADRYLWSQPTLQGSESNLGGRPDLLITSSCVRPTSENALRIIECKAHRKLGARVVRQEFGKAFDLKIHSYLIWSLTTPGQNIIEGAKKLGIDLCSLEFDTGKRQDYIADPGILRQFVGDTIKKSSNEARFIETINSYRDLTARKMLKGPGD